MSVVQDQSERRFLRQQYREILNSTTDEDEDQTGQSGSLQLQQKLHDVEEIFQRVKMPREAALDSQVVALLAEKSRRQALEMQTEFLIFHPTEFAEKLMTHIDAPRPEADSEEALMGADQWLTVGGLAQHYFKKAPVHTFMFGSFERGPPKKKPERAKRITEEKDKMATKAVVPKQITSVEDRRGRETTIEQVERIHQLLKSLFKRRHHQPLNYFEFVFNPESFGQTVENMFYVSFLVRDGHVRIGLDNQKLPTIEPILSRDGNTETAETRNQVVLSLTKAEWEEIIRVFHINTPAIPTRPSTS